MNTTKQTHFQAFEIAGLAGRDSNEIQSIIRELGIPFIPVYHIDCVQRVIREAQNRDREKLKWNL